MLIQHYHHLTNSQQTLDTQLEREREREREGGSERVSSLPVTNRYGLSIEAEEHHTRYNGVFHGAIVHHINKRRQYTDTQLLQ